MSPRPIRINRRFAGVVVAFLVLAVGATLTFADYTGTATISTQTTTSLATVNPQSVTFSVVEGETATKLIGSDGVIYTITDIDAAYDDKLTLNLYLLNPDVLKNFYNYVLVKVEAQHNGAGASTWTTVDTKYISLDDNYVTFSPGIDFASETNTAGHYRLKATVTYTNFETTGLTPPSFFLDVTQ